MSSVASFQWCTARRFQASAPCLLGCGANAGDAIEHYAVCPVVWRVAARKGRLRIAEPSLSRFMILSCAHDEEMILLAVNIFAVYSATNTVRNACREHEIENLLSDRWNQACHLCPALARTMKEIWNVRSNATS